MRLRALELPVEELPVRDLVWQLDDLHERGCCVWGGAGTLPIDVTSQSGRWLILDGAERLRRAVVLGRATVSVRKVPTWALPLIVAAS